MSKTKSNDRKFLVFGDTQFHKWRATEDPSYWRFLIHQCMLEIHNTVAKEKITDIVFLGDLFESRVNLDGMVVAYALKEFSDMITTFLDADPERRVHLLAGNHDYFGSDCILDVFSDLNERVEVHAHKASFVSYGKGGPTLLFLPYKCSLANLKEGCVADVAFSHNAIAGTPLHSSATTTITTQASSIDFAVVAKHLAPAKVLVLNGHYHDRRSFRDTNGLDIVNVGSPYSMSWRDVDAPERGFSLAQPDNKVAGWFCIFPYTLPAFPRFLSDKQNARPIDFVKPQAAPILDRSKDKETRSQQSVHEVGGGSLQDAITAYTKLNTLNRESQVRLSQLGLNILGGK